MQKLIKDFGRLKNFEIYARDLYQVKLLPMINNPDDRIIIQGIILDEQRHADAVGEIINILSKL